MHRIELGAYIGQVSQLISSDMTTLDDLRRIDKRGLALIVKRLSENMPVKQWQIFASEVEKLREMQI